VRNFLLERQYSTPKDALRVYTRIFFLNDNPESSDRLNRQYLRGCELAVGAPEAKTLWMRNKTGLSASPSTPRSGLIFRDNKSPPAPAFWRFGS
jgi:hypothetical protein